VRVRHRVTIVFDGNECEYHMILTLVLRQLQRGRLTGEVSVGDGGYTYVVETDHSRQEQDGDGD
jgi:hypothetical protein